MTLRPYWLKFPDRATAESLGTAIGFLKRDSQGNVLDEWQEPGSAWCYRVIDPCTSHSSIPPGAVIDGFHVNVLAHPEAWPAQLAAYEVDPATPCNVYGGCPAERPEGGWGDI